LLVNRLPQILAQKRVSIRQLSKMTGVTYTTVWAMVQGQRRSIQLDVLDAVCEVLGIQPGDIYRREPSQPSDQHWMGGEESRRPRPSSALEKKARQPAPTRSDKNAGQASNRPVKEDPQSEWRAW
jgi:putative transcriptional regulator